MTLFLTDLASMMVTTPISQSFPDFQYFGVSQSRFHPEASFAIIPNRYQEIRCFDSISGSDGWDWCGSATNCPQR